MIDIDKYLGTWHEIARIPNEFQPNMVNVTAEYLMSPTHIDVITNYLDLPNHLDIMQKK